VNSSKSEFPIELFLSLATAPLLVGVVAGQAVGTWLQAIGVNSEEVFRGDRLPVLHFPESNPTEATE
jgi:hypothetical protein